MLEVTSMLSRHLLQTRGHRGLCALRSPGTGGARRGAPAAAASAAAARLRGLAGAVAVLALAGGLCASAARADHLDMTMGGNGQLYTVKAGLYGALFGGMSTEGAAATATSPATPVLALQTTVPGAAPQLQLVPTTDDSAVESSPALIYEDQSSTLFVVWVSTTDMEASALKLAGYSGGQWTQPITVISNPYATKTPPQLAVTRDSYQATDPLSGNVVTHHRTALHLVWAEDSAIGVYQAYYAPVIFEDGVWIGTVPAAVHLNAFDAAEQTAKGGPYLTPLVYTPTVENGRDVNTAITGFASETSGLITAVEADLVPEPFRVLADACAATITGQGAQYFPGQLSSLANQVAATISSGGGATFDPSVLQLINSAAQAQVLAGAADLPTLALKTRAVIIDSGVRLAARGLKVVMPSGAAVTPSQTIEIVPPGGGPSQFVALTVAASRATPAVSGNNGVSLFVSRTGDNAMASWLTADSGSVFYTNTQSDGSWSAPFQLQLTPALDQEQALQMLQQRIY
jgi:hypothetical protein